MNELLRLVLERGSPMTKVNSHCMLENFDQVLHSRHVVLWFNFGQKQHFGAHLANKED